MKYSLLIIFRREFCILFSFLLVTLSCSNDMEIDDSISPEVQNLKTSISTAPNLEFVIQGMVKDNNGIKNINIKYLDWFLDKTIDLNEHPKEFDLNYKFLVPSSAIAGTTHKIQIQITDLGNNITKQEITVNLNLDITKPTLQIVSPLIGGSYVTGENLPIKIEIKDDFGIEVLQIKCSDLNLDEVITIGNSTKIYNYEKEHLIPFGIDKTVTIDFLVRDEQGNESKNSVEVVIGSSITYTNLYIVGGSTWYGWEPTKATKMWQDPTNDKWYICEFYYQTNNDIKFTGQLNWAPFNWGLDPNNNTRIINAQNSEAIGFNDGDGYYRVKFNPYTLEFSYEKMTTNIAEENDMYIMGKGFVGYNLNWNPRDAIPMIKDTNNPYVFRVEVEFSNEVDLKFIGQTDGWGPYDAGFVVGGQTQIPVNYVRGVVGGGTADLKFTGQAGTYEIIYDYFLLRTTIQPK